jgi:hypothetical protein
MGGVVEKQFDVFLSFSFIHSPHHGMDFIP